MENENLRVQISDHGAELSSIYDKAADREAVWIGDPAFWNRHAPVLFPFVGKVNGGFYTHKGVKYPMGQHGFARDNVLLNTPPPKTRIRHKHNFMHIVFFPLFLSCRSHDQKFFFITLKN